MLVEVLELREVDAPRDQLAQGRRVLADAVPGPRRVADAVRRVARPLLRGLGHLEDLEDAHLVEARRVGLAEQGRVGGDAGALLVRVELV